jgi:hypothetical protein
VNVPGMRNFSAVERGAIPERCGQRRINRPSALVG